MTLLIHEFVMFFLFATDGTNALAREWISSFSTTQFSATDRVSKRPKKSHEKELKKLSSLVESALE